MDKIAIYVEGQTEQLIVEKIIYEIAGENNICVELRKAFGGVKSPRIYLQLHSTPPNQSYEYYILIIDSSNDSRVETDIRDNCVKLQESGFKKILGLRDVYPNSVSDLPTLKRYSHAYMPNEVVIPVKTIFAITEIETWFLGEYTHFERVDADLKVERINSELSYDIVNDNLEFDNKYFHSSEVLNSVYQLVGKNYSKKKKRVQEVINYIDYEELYLGVVNRVSSLNEFITELNQFFSYAT